MGVSLIPRASLSLSLAKDKVSPTMNPMFSRQLQASEVKEAYRFYTNDSRGGMVRSLSVLWSWTSELVLPGTTTLS